jgi:hypothetical protein
VFDAMTHAMNWPTAPADSGQHDGIVVQGQPPVPDSAQSAALFSTLPSAESSPIR